MFMLAKNQKQFKCPSTDKWVNKMWYIHTIKYCSAIKKNILIQGATWMNLENNAFCDSIYMKSLEKANLQVQKTDQKVPGAGDRRGQTANRHKGYF